MVTKWNFLYSNKVILRCDKVQENDRDSISTVVEYSLDTETQSRLTGLLENDKRIQHNKLIPYLDTIFVLSLLIGYIIRYSNFFAFPFI